MEERWMLYVLAGAYTFLAVTVFLMIFWPALKCRFMHKKYKSEFGFGDWKEVTCTKCKSKWIEPR